MKSLEELGQLLMRLDGRGYKAYKQIAGRYEGPGFILSIDHVQGDPFAEPSRLRIFVSKSRGNFPLWALENRIRRVAAADFINRRLAHSVRTTRQRCGSGKSGVIEVLTPGQQVLQRTSLFLNEAGEVEARIKVGLPARGRSVLGKAAKNLLLNNVVDVIEASLVYEALNEEDLKHHLDCVEDSQALRAQLSDRGLVSFVANGAILPRRSGVDDRPAYGSNIIDFESPNLRAVTLRAPNAGDISGMGIPEGITLIIGGGYHGKSTLLRAIELGVYDHLPGDGRERVVTIESAVKIRAEDGRSIAGVDISNFIDGLPGGQDTRFFHSENASGSTSQAAGIVEALEVGARCLLLDEDTCATNFMIRDARMQRLVPARNEPITPFIDRAKHLSENLGISTVAVVGGAGDYFDVADCVIGMLDYMPSEQTEEANRIAVEMPSGRDEISRAWMSPALRRPKLSSLDSKHPKKEGKIRVRDVGNMQMGDQELQLGAVEQLVEEAQVRAIANGLLWARKDFENPPLSMDDFYQRIIQRIENEGLQSILKRPTGDCAEFRIIEMAAVLGRLRSLETELIEPEK